MPMPLVRRIEILEGDVNALRQLPEQVSAVASDVAALRGNVTALRGDITELQGDVTQLKVDMTEVRGDITQLKRDMTEVRGALSDGGGALINVGAEFAVVRAEFAAVREEIRTGDEETRRQMRVLHEEVISRIALVAEGRKTRRRGKRQPSTRSFQCSAESPRHRSSAAARISTGVYPLGLAVRRRKSSFIQAQRAMRATSSISSRAISASGARHLR